MIKYNSKAWFALIFQFHKSDTFRRLLPNMLIVAGFAWLIAYLEIEHWKISQNSSPALHSLLGLVISLLLVFRTNTAYERWWEGRKFWGGLVNTSRNLALKIDALLEPGDTTTRNKFEQLIILFPEVLKDHLRNKINGNVPSGLHQPNYVIQQFMHATQDIYNQQKISGEQLLTLNNEVTEYANICGGCERIRKTPIPYSYSLFLKKFVFVYVMSFPFAFMKELGYMTIPAVTFLFYVLVSLEIIAEEIEDPFGEDANDLPTDEIAQTIAVNVKEIFANNNHSTST
jgi:putative membrane protein